LFRLAAAPSHGEDVAAFNAQLKRALKDEGLI
jgi:hypothetical protein